ncbi:MAG: ribose-5-phosphate isomerase RpiA [Candidatus Thorarchaeota archaeon]
MTADEEKRFAAEAALNHVSDGMCVGVGTGSTVEIFIELLVEKIASENISITAVPSSYATEIKLHDSGISTIPLSRVTGLACAVDGADEVDSNLALIKGGGAALLREKIIAEASEQVVIIVDASKVVKTLGTRMPVPVEILPADLSLSMARIQKLGGSPMVRQAQRKAGPIITDNGNFILDVTFPQIPGPAKLERQLNAIPGVLENGIFPNQADVVYVGQETGAKLLQR